MSCDYRSDPFDAEIYVDVYSVLQSYSEYVMQLKTCHISSQSDVI